MCHGLCRPRACKAQYTEITVRRTDITSQTLLPAYAPVPLPLQRIFKAAFAAAQASFHSAAQRRAALPQQPQQQGQLSEDTDALASAVRLLSSVLFWDFTHGADRARNVASVLRDSDCDSNKSRNLVSVLSDRHLLNT